jgi:hypothetical protein
MRGGISSEAERLLFSQELSQCGSLIDHFIYNTENNYL